MPNNWTPIRADCHHCGREVDASWKVYEAAFVVCPDCNGLTEIAWPPAPPGVDAETGEITNVLQSARSPYAER
mgnify:FL=1